jgi:hypothetical protein
LTVPYTDHLDFDDYDDGVSRSGPTCRRCGKTGLEWSRSASGWVLLNEVGQPHRCNPALLRKQVIDDFDDLTQE